MSHEQRPDEPREPWKRKMGAEFSGLERPRDFLVAFLAVAVLITIALVIAYVAFG